MTRNAMVKKIGDVLGVRELDGVRHIDRPSWWLRQMFSEVRSKGELVECPKVDQESGNIFARGPGRIIQKLAILIVCFVRIFKFRTSR